VVEKVGVTLPTSIQSKLKNRRAWSLSLIKDRIRQRRENEGGSDSTPRTRPDSPSDPGDVLPGDEWKVKTGHRDAAQDARHSTRPASGGVPPLEGESRGTGRIQRIINKFTIDRYSRKEKEEAGKDALQLLITSDLFTPNLVKALTETLASDNSSKKTREYAASCLAAIDHHGRWDLMNEQSHRAILKGLTDSSTTKETKRKCMFMIWQMDKKNVGWMDMREETDELSKVLMSKKFAYRSRDGFIKLEAFWVLMNRIPENPECATQNTVDVLKRIGSSKRIGWRYSDRKKSTANDLLDVLTEERLDLEI
ncbi:MAG: hypothetical protein ABH950_08970, partial [Candidatus Altiarchaeota archaeon]